MEAVGDLAGYDGRLKLEDVLYERGVMPRADTKHDLGVDRLPGE